MHLLFVVTATLSLTLTVNAAGCCIKDSYQISGGGVQGQMYHAQPELYLLDKYMMAFDVKSQRALLNMTIRDAVTGHHDVETIYFVEENGKRVRYVVIDNNLCIHLPAFGSWMKTCLPPNTRVVANFSFGGQLNCSAVTFSNSGSYESIDYMSTTAMLISQKCIPLAAATLVRSENRTEGIESELDIANLLLYYDVKLLESTNIFTLPKICSKPNNLETAGTSKNDLVISHLMEGVESFNVFTILNRLAQLSSSEVQKKA